MNAFLARVSLAAALALAGAAVAQDGEASSPDGESLYQTHCAACHQSEGQGLGTFPTLVDNAVVLGDEHELVDLVLHGRAAMPAFAGTLDDAEVSAVLTHVRSAWGNDAEPIDEAQAADIHRDRAGGVPLARGRLRGRQARPE